MGTRKKVPIRSDGTHEYFIDAKRAALGEYYVDTEGRKVFRNQRGEPYYFGNFEGQVVPIIICPPFIPRVRSIARPSGGQSLGQGSYRMGTGIGTN